VVGVEPELVDVGREAQTLGTFGLRAIVEQQIAHATGEIQVIEDHHQLVGQRRK
jgi:hypothetical protein